MEKEVEGGDGGKDRRRKDGRREREARRERGREEDLLINQESLKILKFFLHLLRHLANTKIKL